MPNIGEIRKGTEVGFKGAGKQIWTRCPQCSKERWVAYLHGEPKNKCCNHCASHGSPVPLPKGTLDNPVIGDIRNEKELGHKGRGLVKYNKCSQCGQGYWRTLSYLKKSKTDLCVTCAGIQSNTGANSNKWKGGKSTTKQGYTWVWVAKDSPFYAMVNATGKVCEHRLVMAQHLGRCLQTFEIVHHKNGIKNDNRIENLELSMPGAHSVLHSKGYTDGYLKGYREGFNKAMDEKISKLNQEIRLLQLQLQGKL